MATQFYTYLWLREDGTPYYVGKGHGSRAFDSHRHHRPPKDRSKILICLAGSEAEALASEMVMIDLFGRKDCGTGCLHNHTDGGENPPSWLGKKHSQETLQKLSAWIRSPELGAKISAAKKGKTPFMTPEAKAAARAKAGDTMRGRKRPPMSQAWRDNIGAAGRNRKASADTKAKMRAAKLGTKQTPEHIENNRLARKGKKSGPLSSDIKKNMAVAQKIRRSQEFLKTVAWG
jgi:hypothetical protein